MIGKKVKKRHFAVIGPSGVGKSTLIRRILQIFPDMRLAISCTTRDLRDDEVDGVDYHKLTEDKFSEYLSKDLFAESNPHMDASYGTLRSECDITHESVIFDVEVNGANNLKKIFPDLVTIFISPPSVEVLRERLQKRVTEGKMAASKVPGRIARYEYEQQFADGFDYHLVNDDLNGCFADLAGIIAKELGIVIIAIDGTAGCGKGSHSKKLAADLGGYHLDSGLIYRKLAYYCGVLHDWDPRFEGVERILNDFIAEYPKLPLEDDSLFRSDQVNKIITSWSSLPLARQAVFMVQMMALYSQGHMVVVVEGRDITTFICRYASFRFYIDCDLWTRAERRSVQFGGTPNEHHVLLGKRDVDDMTRDLHPLYFDEEGGVIKVLTDRSFSETNAYIKQLVGFQQAA